VTVTDGLDYSIRVSPRARHARIVVRPGGAVEVVLPRGVSHRQVPAMLQARRQWLESAVLRMREVVPQLRDNAPPDEIELPAVGQHFRVGYIYRPERKLSLQQEGNELRLTGPVHDHDAVRCRLHEWLKGQGRMHLPLLLEEAARCMDADYQRVTIRLQRTRWGSCSVQGNISLNARLLLLPLPLLRYVLVHELAHLAQHNHSPTFWQRVARFEPDYKRLRRELTEAGSRLPGWLSA